MSFDALAWRRALESGQSCVEVIVVEVKGSVPVSAGARMLVTSAGLAAGTVGGGKLEARALLEAERLLQQSSQKPPSLLCTWHLNSDLGMTCGGSVTLFFQVWQAGWSIHIFGAGHVSQALVRILATLSCRVVVYDIRSEWLERLPSGVERIRPDTEEATPACVQAIPDGAFVLCISRGHEADRPVLAEALRQHRFAYVGVIGSRAKRAILEKELVAVEGLSAEEARQFVCPIGLPLGGNAPEEIAVSVAAQLLAWRDESLCDSPEKNFYK